MAKPGGTPENLVSNAERTPEKIQENARMGGQKSGEVRREKRRFADLYADVLVKRFELTDETTKQTVAMSGRQLIKTVIGKIISRGDSASVSMIREIREAIDGSKIEHSGTVDLTTLTKEEFEELKAKFLAEHSQKTE